MIRRSLLRIGSSLALLGSVAFVVVVAQRFAVSTEVPIPFDRQHASSLAGQVTQIGFKSVGVYKVTFPTGTDHEVLSQDRIYLVSVPDDVNVTNLPLDQVLTVSGGGLINYFGYKYSDANASVEKAQKNAQAFLTRFPGQFFASAKARTEDAAHGNTLTNFEAARGLTMDRTDTTTGALLARNSLYLFIVNESGSVDMRIRPTVASPVCGNGVIEGSEVCDDGGTVAGDGCSNTCNVESGFVCSGTPSVCTPIVCGNNVVEAGEQCDHGSQNGTVGNACDSSCHFAGPTSSFTVTPDSNPVTANVTDGQTGALIMRFSGTVGTGGNVLLGKIALKAASGSVTDAQNYTLTMRPSGSPPSAAVVLKSGVVGTVVFQNFGLGNVNTVTLSGSTTYLFDVFADVSPTPQHRTLQLAFDTGASLYVSVDDGTIAGMGYNVATNGACSTTPCAVQVTTGPNILWTISPIPVCGNGLKEAGEACDDGALVNGDGCSDTCTVVGEFHCSGSAPTVCVSYLNFVKVLADINPTDNTVDPDEALALELLVGDAPGQPYSAVSQYDINSDGVVDNTDVTIIFAQLDILSPP